MTVRDSHVVKSGDDWAVINEGSSTPLSTHKTLPEAIKAALPIAKKLQGEVIMHYREDLSEILKKPEFQVNTNN